MLATSMTCSQYHVRGQFIKSMGTGPKTGPVPVLEVRKTQRVARLTAETTAFSEARVVLGSMPMPHRTWPSIAHSM